MRDGRARAVARPRVNALGATAATLALLFCGLIAWLWLSAEPDEAARRVATEVVIAMPPPLPLAAPAPAAEAPAQAPAPPAAAMPEPALPAAQPPAAQPSASEPPQVEAPKAEAPKAEAPKAEAPKAEAPATRAPVPAPEARPEPPPQVALVPAPVPDLLEQGKAGPLPRIAPDGRQPWRVYARPFNRQDPRPRIAVVIGNLGLSSAQTDAAIQELPGGVTLAFSPYSRKLEQYIPLARTAGHEVLLSLPMEPVSYPANDPGPQALLTALTPAENLDRLTWLLSRFTGYVGVTNYMGSRFTASDRDIRPILAELGKRGLLFFDSRSGANSLAGRIAAQLGLPTAANERFIDTQASRAAIDQMLNAVEEEAKQKGVGIAMGFPYPVTIERVAAWAATLPDKGILLAPVSAIVSQGRGS